MPVVGRGVGAGVGLWVGTGVGEGVAEGVAVGSSVGLADGVGVAVGASLGLAAACDTLGEALPPPIGAIAQLTRVEAAIARMRNLPAKASERR